MHKFRCISITYASVKRRASFLPFIRSRFDDKSICENFGIFLGFGPQEPLTREPILDYPEGFAVDFVTDACGASVQRGRAVSDTAVQRAPRAVQEARAVQRAALPLDAEVVPHHAIQLCSAGGPLPVQRCSAHHSLCNGAECAAGEAAVQRSLPAVQARRSALAAAVARRAPHHGAAKVRR